MILVSNRTIAAALLIVTVLPALVVLGSPPTNGSPLSHDMAGALSHVAASPTPQSGQIGGGGALDSAFVIDDKALVIVNEPSWTGFFEPASNGSHVYAASLYLQAYDLTAGNVTLKIALWEAGRGNGWIGNSSVLLTPHAETDVTLTLKADASWVTARVYLGGGKIYWTGEVATPISLLPVSFLDMGGLDLLGLTILYEGVATLMLCVVLAKRVQKKTVWAPRFSMPVIGHVILAGVLATVIFEYQWINVTFAGWSPLVYCFGVAPLAFVWSLSLFNKSRRVEIRQTLIRQSESGLANRRWIIRIADVAGIGTILIIEDWLDWLARLCGVYTILKAEGDKDELPPFVAALLTKNSSPTKSPRMNGASMKPRAITDFPILNEQEDELTATLFTRSGAPLTITRATLTIHRRVTVPARMSKDGQTVIPAHEVNRLARPHWTPPKASWDLHSIHYRWVSLWLAELAETEDIVEAFETTQSELFLLRSHMDREIERRVARRLAALKSVRLRSTDPLEAAEAAALARASAEPKEAKE